MNGIVSERIDASVASATRTEKILIKKIRQMDAREIVYMSITELALKIDVAEATILRYCKKIGYKGFQDFKLSLSQDMAKEVPIDVNNKSQYLMEQINKTVSKDCSLFDQNSIDEVTSLLIGAGTICCFGVGNSAVACNYLNARLLKLGFNVVVSSDPHHQSIVASNLSKKDLLILISVTGSTKDIIDVAKIAEKNGVPVVVVTNYPSSPLAKYAKFLFVSYGKEMAFQGGTTVSIISQIYVLGAICEHIESLMGEDAMKKVVKGAKSVSDKAL